MIDPNDNFRRLALGLAALIRNKAVIAAMQAIVATLSLLTFFLFGQDFFGWWHLPISDGTDTAWVGLMTALSFAVCAFFTLLAVVASVSLTRSRHGQSPRMSRIIRMAFVPAVYGLPGAWGWAYLTNRDSRVLGTFAVVYYVSYNALTFLLTIQEQLAEIRRKRGNMLMGAKAPLHRRLRTALRSLWRRSWTRLKGAAWRRCWRLTHPRYLKRLSKLDRALAGAAIRNDTPRILASLKRGADVNARFLYGMSVLSLAAHHGKAEAAQILLTHGAEADALGYLRMTPLMSAASNGHTEIVRALLGDGADISLKCVRGLTALEYARRGKHSDIVALLESQRSACDRPSPAGHGV